MICRRGELFGEINKGKRQVRGGGNAGRDALPGSAPARKTCGSKCSGFVICFSATGAYVASVPQRLLGRTSCSSIASV